MSDNYEKALLNGDPETIIDIFSSDDDPVFVDDMDDFELDSDDEDVESDNDDLIDEDSYDEDEDSNDEDEDLKTVEQKENDLVNYEPLELEQENDDDDDLKEDINKSKYVTGDDRISFPFLTLFEKVMLVGTRAKQIANGSLTTIDVSTLKIVTPITIAEEELKQKKIPFMIERPMPSGKIELWSLDDLIILDD